MGRNGNKSSGANEEWQKQGRKKQNLPCNSICKKMGFACNLTAREQKHDQNTSVTRSEQSGFSLG